MPDTSRSWRDILRDLGSLRSGKMPDASRAPGTPDPDHDPVEDRRMAMATRRNRGENRDVNLPLSSAGPAVRALMTRAQK